MQKKSNTNIIELFENYINQIYGNNYAEYLATENPNRYNSEYNFFIQQNYNI